MRNHLGNGQPKVTGLASLSTAQIAVTPLAGALLVVYAWTKDPRLLIPALAIGSLAVILWLVRRLYESDLYKKAMRLAEAGRHLEAMGLLITAEEAWALNTAHSTPKTIANDFRRLTAIVNALQSQAHKLGRDLNTENLARVIEVYIDIYSNRKNLMFGTHRLKAQAREEIKLADKTFPVLRAQFRATCQDFHRTSGGQLISGQLS